MINLKEFSQPKLREAISILLLVFIILGIPIISVTGLPPHLPILSAIVFLLLYGCAKHVKFSEMQKGMVQSVSSGMGAIYLFFFIGILISALMAAGTIPTLMYYGLSIISVKTFYLSTFIITAIVGISIGSSLTTVATLGVAMLGIAEAFNLDPAITAGAVISGAFFGDKMSPLSDTTGIAASIVGIDLFDHIKNMMYTTVPAFLISSVFFTLLSPWQASASPAALEYFKTGIKQTGLVSPLSLILLFMLIVFSLLKVPAIISIIFVSVSGAIISLFQTDINFVKLADIFFNGYKAEKISGALAGLLNRGGISSMFFTITIVILALSLGGLLFTLGIIPRILHHLYDILNSSFRTKLAVALTAAGVNLIIGEQYLSILLAGKTFKPIYDRLNLPSKDLSRTLEDSGTVVNPLVPWSVCGVFITKTLGIGTLTYAPFAIFCYISLVLTLIIKPKVTKSNHKQ